ncbi:hypothetical protein IB285_08225 [Erythrobacter sp. KMU-140]|uniref:Uncharacterized protein n=2 Tax=Erythrobacter rubeus TaxID=2760803 RepID=A0ABR8KT20_9SPHN|nr:hypothetical protein [Erythrobacter rubeus]
MPGEESLRSNEPETKETHINWRLPNFFTYALFVLLLIALNTESPGQYFDSIEDSDINSVTVGVLAILTRWNATLYADRVDAFNPPTPLDAKRANEQVKALANAINAIAAAALIAVCVKQLPLDEPNYTLIVITAGFAFWVHTGGRNLLGRLKDESTS